MNIFCSNIKEVIFKKFRVEVDVFISKKKMLVYFAFDKPLVSYPFFHDIINLVFSCWREQKKFFLSYEMLYPKLNSSM